jgi:hypothetical protein
MPGDAYLSQRRLNAVALDVLRVGFQVVAIPACASSIPIIEI